MYERTVKKKKKVLERDLTEEGIKSKMGIKIGSQISCSKFSFGIHDFKHVIIDFD